MAQPGTNQSQPGWLQPASLPLTSGAGGLFVESLIENVELLPPLFARLDPDLLWAQVGDVLGHLKWGSFAISSDANARDTCSFTLTKFTSKQNIEPGAPVSVRQQGVLLFAGLVEKASPELSFVAGQAVNYAYAVQCVDYNQYLDRRRMAEAFQNTTTDAIVRSIVEVYLSPEGVTIGGIEPGAAVAIAKYPYTTTRQAIDEAGVTSGQVWYVDYQKSFWMHPPMSRVLDQVLTKANITAVRFSSDLQDYRNRQYVGGGQDTVGPEVEEFTGDGVQRSFTVGFPLAAEPSITVNSVAVVVGSKDSGSGGWLWAREDATIQAPVAPVSGAAIEITYTGLTPLLVIQDDPDQIEARQAIEGGTGLYENFEKNEKIESGALAVEYGAGLLRKYGDVNVAAEVELTTRQCPWIRGVTAGRAVRLTIAEQEVDEVFLIQRIQVRDLGKQELRYTLSLVDRDRVDTLYDFFRKLAEKSAAVSLRENEQIAVGRGLSDATGMMEEVGHTVSTYAGLPLVEVALVEESEVV